MKFIVSLLIFFSVSGFAIPNYFGIDSVVRDASATNIPTAFTDGDALLLTGILSKGHIAIQNDTLVDVGVCFKVSVAADCVVDLLVLAGQGVILDEVRISTSIFVRSEGAAIAVGQIYIGTW